MLINMKCPSCGAQTQFDDSKEFMFCQYCGGKVANIAEQLNINQQVSVSGTVVHVQDRSNDPNLYISYNTNNASVGLVSRIVSTGVKNTYVNGQTLSFHLNQGPQTVILKIGKKNYSRNIVIPPDNSPVRIYASFNGRAQISIDQPQVPVSQVSVPGTAQTTQFQTGTSFAQTSVPVNASQAIPTTTVVPQVSGKPKAPLSIVAFVLALTFYLSWAGAGLGAVEIFVLDKKKEKNHLFSYLAMGIGVFLTICLIFGLVGAGSKTKTNTSAVPDTSVENTVEENKESQSSEKETTEATTKEITTTTVDYTAGMDLSTANAFNAGLLYLRYTNFSRKGLIDQLSSEYGDGYTEEQATEAVDAIESFELVNWKEEAVACAQDYLKYTAFSRQGLIDQLDSDYGSQFTEDEATYAVDYLEENNLVDWNEQAVRSAKSYLEFMEFSRKELIDQLSSEYGSGFTEEQAIYAADQVGLT